jgi:hypothetical protein
VIIQSRALMKVLDPLLGTVNRLVPVTSFVFKEEEKKKKTKD